jgi:hypothetical protein
MSKSLDCYRINWWEWIDDKSRQRATIPVVATHADVEIHSQRFEFEFDMDKEYAVRTQRLHEFTRALDLMFHFGIGEGKRQVREALGI